MGVKNMALCLKVFTAVILFLPHLHLVSPQTTTLADLDSEVASLTDAYYDLQTVIPVQTITNTMHVNVAMDLTSIATFGDDSCQYMTAVGYLTLTWTEERVTKTSNDVSTTISTSVLWTPPLILANSVTIASQIGTDTKSLRFNFFSAVVRWEPWISVTVKCESNFKFFPFDEHICAFQFRALTFTADELLLSISSSTINTEFYVENSEWTLKTTSSRTFIQNSKSFVEFKVNIARKPRYYISVIVFPIFLLSMVHVFAFFIPTSSSERITFSVTMFVSFVILLSVSLTDFIPKSAIMTSLLVYYLLSELLLNALVCLMVVFSVKARSPDREPSFRSRFFTSFMSSSRRLTRNRTNIVPSSDVISTPSPRDVDTGTRTSAWDELSASPDNESRKLKQKSSVGNPSVGIGVALDGISFGVFFVVNICFTVAFFLPLAFNAE